MSDRTADILATTGVHIGGTDYDQKLSLEQVMPLLGYRHLGPERREVPSRVFFDLSTWHLIHWQYQPKAIAHAKTLRSNYSDARLHERLMQVLTERHGHHIAHEVEQAKIRCSQSNADARLDLAYVEPDLHAAMTAGGIQDHLQALLARTVACARECVQAAGLAPRPAPASCGFVFSGPPMSFATWITFFIAACIIAVSPGSGAVLSMSHGLSFGVRRTTATILGLQSGLMMIFFIAGAGVETRVDRVGDVLGAAVQRRQQQLLEEGHHDGGGDQRRARRHPRDDSRRRHNRHSRAGRWRGARRRWRL